jgi:hypothetical protein
MAGRARVTGLFWRGSDARCAREFPSLAISETAGNATWQGAQSATTHLQMVQQTLPCERPPLTGASRSSWGEGRGPRHDAKGHKKMIRTALASVALVAVVGLNTPARAALAVLEETYSFSGTCTDCLGDVRATLVLEDYTQGNSITTANFVSFSYSGSNLDPSFTISPADLTSISGVIPSDLPSPARVNISFLTDLSNFVTVSDGTWYVDVSDYGTNGTWNAVPEPSTWAMMLLGLAGLGFAGYRASRRTAAAA